MSGEGKMALGDECTSTLNETQRKPDINEMNNGDAVANDPRAFTVHSAIRTPPPGFGSMSSKMGDASAASYLEVNRLGAGSAPPPPGFNTTPDQRIAHHRHPTTGDHSGSDLNVTFDGVSFSGGVSNAAIGLSSSDKDVNSIQLMKRPVNNGSAALLLPSDLEASEIDGDKRSKSFANLAEALGEGLAESMNDSFFDGRKFSGVHAVAPSSLAQANKKVNNDQRTVDSSLFASTSGSSSDVGIDNYARQSRHTVSRLMASTNNGVGLGTGFTRQIELQNSSNLCSENSKTSYVSTMGAVTVIEPSSRPPSAISPSPQIIIPGSGTHNVHFASQQISSSNNNDNSENDPNNFLSGVTQRMLHLNSSNSSEGRASAPPQVFDPRSREFPVSSAALQYHTASSLQQRAAELRELKVHKQEQQMPPSRTPEPSIANSPSIYLRNHNVMHSHTDSNTSSQAPNKSSNVDASRTRKQDQERLAEDEVKSFLWGVLDTSKSELSHSINSNNSTNSSLSTQNAPSRSLAILYASQLFIPDVRSTCEAFGSLLYFRPEFCHNRGVIFVGYHDLRSARHAALELKSCLKSLATPHLDHSEDLHAQHSSDVKVMYCVSLTSSSAIDDSILNLSNLPNNVDEKNISGTMTSYGAVQSIQFHSEGRERPGIGREDNAPLSCSVEFYDVQDSSQALLEIESTFPWGTGVSASLRTRGIHERKRGQDLLALLGRWRHGGDNFNRSINAENLDNNAASCRIPNTSKNTSSILPAYSTGGAVTDTQVKSLLHSAREPSPAITSASSSPRPLPPNDTKTPSPGPVGHVHQLPSNGNGGAGPPTPAAATSYQPTAQLAIGPDGQYSYVIVNTHGYHAGAPPPTPYPHHSGTLVQPLQQHVVHGPHGTYVTTTPAPPQHVSAYPGPGQNYWLHPAHSHLPHAPHSVPTYHHIPGGTVVSGQSFVDVGVGGHPGAPSHPAPIYTPGIQVATLNNTDSSLSSGNSSNGISHIKRSSSDGHSSRRTDGTSGASNVATKGSGTTGDSNDSTHLALDIQAVRSSSDTRTSLMVRNIPNKYTQSMLLSEFVECGHGPDKIDFFYLPIDFKNKCNRGYAFVNLVDYRDIITFHERHNGKHWKVFNSDKICDMTYARIQGKAGMLKRFQNSALMEKDAEYRPLVFVSHGPNKGKREEIFGSS